MWDDGEDFVDAREISERLGLRNPRTVLDLRVHRLAFPGPVARWGRTLMWSWPEVETWASTALPMLPSTFFGPRVGSPVA